MMKSACSALCTASFVSTRFMKPVRCVTVIVAAYAAMPNGGQVSAAAARDRTIRFTQVCSGFRLACSSRVTGRPTISSAGATMISKRCWIMWSQNSTSS